MYMKDEQDGLNSAIPTSWTRPHMLRKGPGPGAESGLYGRVLDQDLASHIPDLASESCSIIPHDIASHHIA